MLASSHFSGPGKRPQPVLGQVLSGSYMHYNLTEILSKASRDGVLLWIMSKSLGVRGTQDERRESGTQ